MKNNNYDSWDDDNEDDELDVNWKNIFVGLGVAALAAFIFAPDFIKGIWAKITGKTATT